MTTEQIGGRKPKRPRPLSYYQEKPQRINGLRGFWTTCLRHHAGDARTMTNWLIARGLAAQDPVPQNGAWSDHGRPRYSDRLPRWWTPPPLPPEFLEDGHPLCPF